MKRKPSSRRRFFQDSAALAGLAMGVGQSSLAQTPQAEEAGATPTGVRAYGERSKYDTFTRLEDDHEEAGLTTPIQDMLGIITPSGLHFLMDHDHRKDLLDVDPNRHRLLIHGLVNRPLIFTVDELKSLPSVSRIYFIECNGNSQPQRGVDSVQRLHGRTSCSEWTGVPLSLLLKEAGVQQGAKWLLAEGADRKKYTTSIPLEKALDDALVAYGQNGESIRPEQGHPLRLIIPGFEGNISMKWLRRIKLGDKPFMPRFQAAGNSELRMDGKAVWHNFEMGAKSIITRPGGGQKLPGPGFYEIRGLAWSGGGAVRKVEVSTDGGRSWKDARLQEPVLRFAFARFTLDWRWNGEETVLQSRCTDERGEVQPTVAQMASVRGVTVEYLLGIGERYKDMGPGNHHNSIQPWKITREGSVLNALFS